MLVNVQMPDLNQYRRAEDKVVALQQYVFNLTQQLNHVLSNLDEENLGKDLLQRVSQTKNGEAQPTNIQQTGASCEACKPLLDAIKVSDEEIDVGERYISNARFR